MALELSEAARELVLEASQDPALGERWGSGRCCARRHSLGQLRVAPPSLSPVEISTVKQRRTLLTSLSKVAQHLALILTQIRSEAPVHLCGLLGFRPTEPLS